MRVLLDTEHNGELSCAREQIVELNATLDQRECQYEMTIASMTAVHETETARRARDAQNEVSRLTSLHIAEFKAVTTEAQVNVDNYKARHQQQVKELQKKEKQTRIQQQAEVNAKVKAEVELRIMDYRNASSVYHDKMACRISVGLSAPAID